MRWTSCDSAAHLRLAVSAEDDRTEARQLGWVIEVVDGESPAKVPAGAIRAHGGAVELSWFDEPGDDNRPFEVTYRVIAVDLAGNRSEPSEPITVRHPGFKRAEVDLQPLPDARKACASGDADSCVWAGKMLFHGFQVERDERQGSAFYRRACALGSAVACDWVGDYARASSLYDTQCSSGSGDACLALGHMHLDGRGFPEDRADANRFCPASAES
jgi:hypothetical protein